MKMNLGMKIGAGFGALVIIASILGGMAIVNMRNVGNLSTMLKNEYVPEVAVANNIERYSLLTMYGMRGYGFTGEQKFLDSGKENLAQVNKFLGDAKNLAENSVDLVALKEQVADVTGQVVAYGKLVEEIVSTNEKINGNRQILAASSAKYMGACNEYLAGQNRKMKGNIDAGADGEKLKGRLWKITTVNDIIDIGNAIRLAAWRSQAERSPKIIQDAQKYFTEIAQKFDELRATTTKEADLKKINDTEESANQYKAAMNDLLKNWLILQKLEADQNEVAAKVLAAAQSTAKDGMQGTEKIAEQAVSSLETASTIMIYGLIAALIMGVIIAYFITRSITQPITRTVKMLDEMGMGHLDIRLKMDRSDEIGQMADTMDKFSDHLQHVVVKALQQLSDGDLTFDVSQKDAKDVIGAALTKTSDDLNRIVAEILAATEQIAAGSGQVSDSSQSLSQGATESAAALEQITASMTEMGSQTTTNAENATQANDLATKAKSAAETGNAQMQNMVTAMGEINEAGQNISKIIKVIDEIAFQTNLLALNAAVEAARAGRHGKGFAVVAEEVRNLAARSAKAAKETAELIEGSVAKTNNGTTIARETAESLAEIVTAVSKVTGLVGEIAAASNEQAEGISQVNNGLGQIDQVTQQNTASAEEGAAAAEELSSQAVHLKGLMSTFTIKGGNQPEPAGQQILAMEASTAAPAEGSWGAAAGKAGQNPSEVIALDDKEFGKY